jgi:hypothetical protein
MSEFEPIMGLGAWRISLRSTRFARDAQVMPVIGSSMC